jgi:hypothetical protein
MTKEQQLRLRDLTVTLIRSSVSRISVKKITWVSVQEAHLIELANFIYECTEEGSGYRYEMVRKEVSDASKIMGSL